MTSREEVKNLIFEVIDNYNETQTDEKKKIKINEDTKLIGGESVLDSLGLVTLLVDIEYMLEEKLGVSKIITNEKAMFQAKSPFRTINTLTDYICSLEV